MDPNATAPCGDPNYIDDNFLMFKDEAACALNVPAQHGLMAFWVAVFGLCLLENVVANVRGVDRSPTNVRVLYSMWLCAIVAFVGYTLARPTASLLDGTDRPVLLTLLTVRLVCGAVMGHTMNNSLVKAFLSTIGHLPKGALKEDDTYRSHRRYVRVLQWLYAAITVMCIVCMAAFVDVLPNAIDFGGDNNRREILLTVAWACYAGSFCSSCVLLAIATSRIRLMVHECVVFREKQGSNSNEESASGKGDDHKNSSSSSGAGAGNGVAKVQLGPGATVNVDKETKKLLELSDRLRRGVMSLLVATLFGGTFLIVACVIGMRYWILHIQMFQNLMIVMTQLNLFRSWPLVAFSPGAVGQSANTQNSSSGANKDSSPRKQSISVKPIDNTASKDSDNDGGKAHDEQVSIGKISIRLDELHPAVGALAADNN